MKLPINIAVACLLSVMVCAQSDSTTILYVGHTNVSYKKGINRWFPTLAYSHDKVAKTHNYSGNWDFDGDLIKDSLFFIGHGEKDNILFSLRLRLSSENYQVRDFPWIVSDIPIPGKYEQLKQYPPGTQRAQIFVVHDFDGSGRDEIYLNNSNNISPIPKEWRKRGATSRFLLIKYEHGHIVVREFKNKWLR